MKGFKFFDDNEEDDLVPIDMTPTWMWAGEFMLREVEGYRWELQTETSYGIMGFLNLFPDHFIVPVFSITGNNIRHEEFTPRTGWGFDITTEFLTIEYYSLVPNENV